MRPPGCCSLKSSICSIAAEKSSPVWTTINSCCCCCWSLLASKSSARDTEARMRKSAECRIPASPSLSKMLLPTSMVEKDCRHRIVSLSVLQASQHLRKLTRDRQNSGISRLAIGTRVQGSFLIGSLGVEIFGFVQSVSLSRLSQNGENISSSNSNGSRQLS
jgi:hypothetical protein